jgi:hypothetical protein
MSSCFFCSRYSPLSVDTKCCSSVHIAGQRKAKPARPDYMQVDVNFGETTYPQSELTNRYLKMVANIGWCDYNVIVDLLMNEEIEHRGKRGVVLEFMSRDAAFASQVGRLLDYIRFKIIVQQLPF